MSKIHRNESQVSRDFEGTLNNVLGIKKQKSRISSLNIKSRELYLNDHQLTTGLNKVSAISSDSDKRHTLTGRISLNQEKNDWKSLNSVEDDDHTYKFNSSTHTPGDEINNGDYEKRELEIIDEAKKFIDQEKKSSEKPSISKISKKPFFFGSDITSDIGVPFETTDITNLAFNLPIIMEGEKTMSVNVYNSYTIDQVIEKVSKKKSLPKETISLYYKKTRLESHVTLSWYNIQSKSNVSMKILKKVNYQGVFLKTVYWISIFTSEKVWEIKKLFSDQINVSHELLELKYKEITLHDNKEFFLYDITPGGLIDIRRRKLSTTEESPDRILHEKSPGFEISQHWLEMTSDLKHCDCEERRLEAMSCGILSTLDKKYEKHKCLETLSEFSNLHHKSCIKSKRKTSVTSLHHELSLKHESKYSDSEVSLEDCIHSEIEKITTSKTIMIEKTDLEYLCHAKNFKSFKRFLRQKIGKKCSLKNVALLYNYAKRLVDFIGQNEENEAQVNKILLYTKHYFIKYYEKDIIAKGGLDRFTLTNQMLTNR